MKDLSIILNLTHECNMACGYCYYSGELLKNPGVMDLKMVEVIFKKLGESSFDNIRIFFHGGEPLLVSTDNYNEIFAMQQHYLEGKTIINSIQTNGTLINDSFINLFKSHDVKIGISLDGPESVHNYYRKNKSGHETFRLIMNNLKKLADNGICVGIISVISDITAEYANMLYPFFKSIKNIRAVDMMPETISSSARILTKMNYSKIMNQIFNQWFFDEECNFELRILTSIVMGFITGIPSMCIFNESCVRKVRFLSIDIHGNVSPCDSLTSLNLGNIMQNSIQSMLENNMTRRNFSISDERKRERCWFCKWFKYCHGGCPSNRTESEINCHCDDFCNIFEYIYSTLENFGIFRNGYLQPSSIETIPNPALRQSIINAAERIKAYA